LNLNELADFLTEQGLEVTLIGNGSQEICQVSSLAHAQADQITFFNDPKRHQELNTTQAGAVILKPEFQALTTANCLLVSNPYYAFAKVSDLLNGFQFTPGIDASASVDKSAKLGNGVYIGAQSVIGASVEIKDHTYIGPGSVVMDRVTIGRQGVIMPNVTIMSDSVIGDQVYLDGGCVIGGQGFGFANDKGEWQKIPQLGRVVIGNRVLVGVNANIHRGAIEDTIIEDNCIIDSLVHIAHNVKVGYGTAIASQVGFAGSTTVGKYCIFGGQVGVNGHIELADGAQFGAKAGVTHSIKSAGNYSGFPAIPTTEWQKNMVRSKHLHEMAQKIRILEKAVQELKTKLE